MDYIYFAFGGLGAVLAVNRMNAVGEKLILSDLYARYSRERPGDPRHKNPRKPKAPDAA